MQIPTRRSSAGPNKELTDVTEKYAARGNLDFFQEAVANLAEDETGHVIVGFVGSRDLPGVALRQAQAILRWDLRPSLWSHVFILSVGPGETAVSPATIIRHVPFDTRTAEFPEPSRNAVSAATLALFADPGRDANVALVALSLADGDLEKIDARLKDPNLDRLRYNFWDSLGVWQSYFWSSALRGNPLRDSVPVPAASYIEYCFEALAIDITPGASERNSAPEHLWNSAKFWHEAYAEGDRKITGSYVLRDKGCSLISADDPPAPSPPPTMGKPSRRQGRK